MADEWWRDHSERIAFAHVLLDSGEIVLIRDLLRYFEKPWNWDPGYERWAAAGRPVQGEPEWEAYIEEEAIYG